MYSAFFGEKSTSEKLYQVALQKKKNWGAQLGEMSGTQQSFIPFVDAVEEVARALRDTGVQMKISSFDLKLRLTSTGGKLRPEGASVLILSTSGPGLGIKIEESFGKVNGIFSVTTTEVVDAGGSKVTITLKPQDKYLENFSKK